MGSRKWDEFIRHAKAIADHGKLDLEDYKFDIGRKVSAAREAVLAEVDGWSVLLKNGLSNNLIHRIPLARFRDWVDQDPDDALTALQAIWTRSDSLVSKRVRAFSKLLPQSDITSDITGPGTRMNVMSILLMGLDVEKYPPFRVTAFEKAYGLAEYDRPEPNADEAALYEHALGFLDRLIMEASKRGLTLRHRLDAQGVVWLSQYDEFWNLADNEDNGTPPVSTLAYDLPTLANKLHLTLDFLEEIKTLLSDKKQVIFQGPPGTGKTYVAQALAEHLAGSKDRVTLVQLHPSYAYEDFVQGFRPELIAERRRLRGGTLPDRNRGPA